MYKYTQAMSSLKTHVPVPSHAASLISLVEKMRQQRSSSSQRRAGLGGPVQSFGRWGRHELGIRVQGILPLLSLGSCCTSVNELKQHLLGDRVRDAIAHSCGQRRKHLRRLRQLTHYRLREVSMQP